MKLSRNDKDAWKIWLPMERLIKVASEKANLLLLSYCQSVSIMAFPHLLASRPPPLIFFYLVCKNTKIQLHFFYWMDFSFFIWILDNTLSCSFFFFFLISSATVATFSFTANGTDCHDWADSNSKNSQERGVFYVYSRIKQLVLVQNKSWHSDIPFYRGKRTCLWWVRCLLSPFVLLVCHSSPHLSHQTHKPSQTFHDTVLSFLNSE